MPKKRIEVWYALYCRDEDAYWTGTNDDMRPEAWADGLEGARLFGNSNSLFALEEAVDKRKRLEAGGWDVQVVIVETADLPFVKAAKVEKKSRQRNSSRSP